jgi:hypothetical protein
MNNSDESDQQADFCANLNTAYNYSTYSLGVIGFLLNAACIYVFLQSNFRKTRSSTTIKYFLFRCIYDSLFLLSSVPYAYTLHKRTYLLNFVHLCSLYLSVVCTFCSKYSDIFAQMDRYASISPSLGFFNKLPHGCIICGMTVFSCFLQVYKILQLNIVQVNENNNTISYEMNMSNLHKTFMDRFFHYTNTILRDLIGSALLIVLNVLILVAFKRAMLKKKKLLFANRQSRQNSNSNAAEYMQVRTNKTPSITSRRLKSEKKTTIMVVIISFKTLVAHIPLILLNMEVEPLVKNYCFVYGTDLFYQLQLSINLFIFYSFNKHFKATLNGLISNTLINNTKNNNNNNNYNNNNNNNNKPNVSTHTDQNQNR